MEGSIKCELLYQVNEELYFKFDRSFFLTEEEVKAWNEELDHYREHSGWMLDGEVSTNCYKDPKIRNLIWSYRKRSDAEKIKPPELMSLESKSYGMGGGFILLEVDSEDFKDLEDHIEPEPMTKDFVIETIVKPYDLKDRFTLGHGLLPTTHYGEDASSGERGKRKERERKRRGVGRKTSNSWLRNSIG
jgi:hypothetical protein